MSNYKKRVKKKNLLFSASALCLATGMLQVPVHAEGLNQETAMSSSISMQTTGSAITPSGSAVTTQSAAPAASNTAASGVQLIDQNATSVVLQNSKVSITVDKSTAKITSVKLVGSDHGNQDFNLVSGSHGGGYSTYNYTIGNTSYAKSVSEANYRVVTNTPDRVEIAMTVNDPSKLPFYVEVHMALEKDSPGIYYYTIYKYTQDMPDGLNIAQLRYAVAAGDPSFNYFVIDDKRGIQQRPTISDTQSWKTLQDTTYALPSGSIYSKYQNISDLEGDNHVFMISNGKLGMSIIQPNKDWVTGGPTKQELTAHDYYNGEILLWHEFTSHYGSPALTPQKGWGKIYGPFYLYVNEGSGNGDAKANVQEMWNDAKQKAQQEEAKWPYTWISDPLYAANERSNVSGKLTIADQVSPKNATVILSPPGQDYQLNNTSYTYSARADAEGKFTIPAVRPGTYTLTAFVDGELGEFKKENVVVGAHSNMDIGNMVWHPESNGKTLWEIGTPDRSAGEFHIYGGPDGFRKYLTWLEYPYEFPHGVDFKVGVSDIKKDWNYFQPAYQTPGTPAELQFRGTTEDHSLTNWKIRFDSKGYSKGTGTLDIALAASVFGTLKVELNGKEIANYDPIPGPEGDNSIYRLADRGIYRQLAPITFPADLIKPGENVITLTPTRAPLAPLTAAGKVDNWMEPMAGIMYDYLRMQVKEGN